MYDKTVVTFQQHRKKHIYIAVSYILTNTHTHTINIFLYMHFDMPFQPCAFGIYINAIIFELFFLVCCGISFFRNNFGVCLPFRAQILQIFSKSKFKPIEIRIIKFIALWQSLKASKNLNFGNRCRIRTRGSSVKFLD